MGSQSIHSVDLWFESERISGVKFQCHLHLHRRAWARMVIRAHQECLMKEIRVASNVITGSAPTINPTADAPIPESASGCG